jgi:hypothetical protein
MWGRKKKVEPERKPEEPQPQRLTDAIRRAKLENAERSSVVVDLRDAELTRLELLNEALDPLFAEIPAEIELFDRGISKGETPRLWIDQVAHVVMGRDKRIYRFVLDTRYGRKILEESPNAGEIVEAVTNYVARRLIERERALADEPPPQLRETPRRETTSERRRRHWRILWRVLFRGLVILAFVYLAIWYLATH